MPARLKIRRIARQIFAMIESPFELRQRPHHVLLADRFVSADDGALDVTEHRVHPLERGMPRRPRA